MKLFFRTLFVLFCLLGATVLPAANFTVTNNSGSGPGSLQEALDNAGGNGQTDTIQFLSVLDGATIYLTGSVLTFNNNDGLPATLDASNLPHGITLRRHSGTNFVLYNDANLTVKGVTISGGKNGAVQNYGNLTLERCTISGNSGGSTILNANVGTATLRQCTVSGNTWAGTGGVLYVYNGAVKFIHCTVAGNATATGAIYRAAGTSLELENSIVAGNGADDGGDIDGPGTLTVTGANIVQTFITGTPATGSGTVTAADPQLAPLGDYGGATQTRPPLSAASPAVDKAIGSVETTDQRGFTRLLDGDLSGTVEQDIGAVEFASGNNDLAGLVLSVGSLDPVFAAATTAYTASVSNSATGLTVTPTQAHAAATITVNNQAATSGSPSSISLQVGTNPIAIVVTAQDGTKKTYTVTVTRLSNDPTLSGLTLSAGTLAPPLPNPAPVYTASVPFEVSSLTVTAEATSAVARVSINGAPSTLASANANVTLAVGQNPIVVNVTAQDDTPRQYNLNIFRAANAKLSALSVSGGALNPGFDKTITSYTVAVSSTTDSTTVTPTVEDSAATVKVNAILVNSGAASGNIALQRGTTTITVVVTPVTGAARIYTVNVVRPYLVDNPLQTGTGSLRDVLDAANANPGPDVIVIDPSVIGIGVGNDPYQIINGSEVTIDASAVPGGLQINGADGTTIFSNQGTLTLIGLKLVHGVGGLFNSGTLTMRQCTVSDCATSSVAGAVGNFGTLTMDRCTLSGNRAQSGGAIFNTGSATLRNCTITGNTAAAEGGGIDAPVGSVSLTHCTVVGNSAPTAGGILLGNSGTSLALSYSIVGGNSGTYPDLYSFGTVTLTGANIVQQGIENGVVTGSGSISQVDPKLMPLGNYGSFLETMQPQPDSPAIDAAVGSTETLDERGRPRPIDGDLNGSPAADLGAVEYANGNNLLTSLTVSAGALSPAFQSGTTNYSIRVPYATSTVTVVPTAAYAGSTLTVNSVAIASGATSNAIQLADGGFTLITIEVTAQTGFKNSYTLIFTRNTRPGPPYAFINGTTGDEQTYTLSFNDTDLDGDTVTLTGVTAEPGLTIKSRNGKDVTFQPATDFVGQAALLCTVQDSFGDSLTGYVFVTVSDNDAPTIEVGELPPTVFFVGTALPAYTANATATDNVHVNSFTQSHGAGTIPPVGDFTVTLTAEDDAGNQTTLDIPVSVRPLLAPSAKTLATGMPAPGHNTNGLPDDALIASFGPPATDDDGDLAFVAKWTSATKGKGTGLFLNDQCLAVVGGDASVITGVTGAKWKSFSDPVVDAGHVACIAKLSTGASAVIFNAVGSTLGKVALTGETGTNDGAKFKSFKTVTVVGDEVGFLATLANGTGTTPKTTAANDTGIWLTGSIITGASTHALALREGDSSGGRTIKTLVSFLPGSGSAGCGRGTVIVPTDGGDPQIGALVKFAGPPAQGLIFQDVDESDFTLISLSGDGATGLNNGATFASYGVPARNSAETTAFLGKLTVSSTVSKVEASGIFAGPELDGRFATVARVDGPADDAGTGAKFKLLKDPVLSEDGDIAFSATVSNVKGLGAQTLWWKRAGQLQPELLAQGGKRPGPDLSADAQFKSFTSLAIAGGGRGPIFAATLVPKKGGVLASSATGVWAVDFTGAVRKLFCTGDQIDFGGGTMKTVKTFTLLNATAGTTGLTRSFNNAAQVVWLATFKEDKTQAIITTEVP